MIFVVLPECNMCIIQRLFSNYNAFVMRRRLFGFIENKLQFLLIYNIVTVHSNISEINQ